MKKRNLLFFAPLAVFALAMPSCGKSATNYKLKRQTYTNHSDWVGCEYNTVTGDVNFKSGFAKVAKEAYEKQGPKMDDDLHQPFGSYKLKENGLDKATITTKAELHVDGEGTIYINYREGDTLVVDLSKLGGTVADTIKTEWNVGEGYLKSTDSLGGFNYIVKDEKGDYWRCIGSKIKDKQYRYKVTDYINKVGGFENAVVIEHAMNSGLPVDEDEEQFIECEGFDISSFGGCGPKAKSASEYEVGYMNYLDIGTLLLGNGNVTFGELPGLAIIDVATLVIDYLELDIDLLDCSYNGNKNGSDSTKASIDIGFKNEDLSFIKDIIEGVEKYLGEELPIEIPTLDGKGTLNYFLSYENNFVRQQEILIDVKDTDFVLKPKAVEEVANKPVEQFPIAADLKGVDLTAVLNEDVKAGTCVKDKVDLSKYEIFTPIDPGALFRI